jgi:hypothetical protein
MRHRSRTFEGLLANESGKKSRRRFPSRSGISSHSGRIGIVASDSLDNIKVFSLVVPDEVPAQSLPQRRLS